VRYAALCVDYDGTIATHGVVDEDTREALRRLKSSGRRLVLVTGRELDDLERAFDGTEIFDRIVAENGALLVRPSSKEVVPLAGPPPPEFVERLRAAGVSPLSTGHVIVATWEPNEEAVLAAIRDLGLELQVIFNKGAVMILPSGVNKATGLAAALEELGLSPHNAVGAGDAENDHAFLTLCECSVAVANALPSLKETADFVTRGGHGAGVTEVIDLLLADETALAPVRRLLAVGSSGDQAVTLAPYGEVVLAAGPSGSGKSTFAMALLERLAEAAYQFCVVDPEGDYSGVEGAVVLGDSDRAPAVDEVVGALSKPSAGVVAGLLGLRLDDRPEFLDALLPRLSELRTRTARPPWIVIDEAHHMLHRGRGEAQLPSGGGLLLITVHPERLMPQIASQFTVLVATGDVAEGTLRTFAETAGLPVPGMPAGEGQVVLWRLGQEPVRFEIAESRLERRRHVRKYAEGELGEDKSFYFRGPDGKLNLRAQNLEMFARMAEGVDDETWSYHLRRGDIERWFREAIKDDALADEAAGIARAASGDADGGRNRIIEAIGRRYTAPA
jgi:hypothetical protein